MAIAVVAVTVIHVVSHQAIQNIGGFDFRSGYQYVVPVPDSDEQQYFELRKLWRAGGVPDISGMVPVLEGTTPANGRLTPVLGIDLLADISANQSTELSFADTSLLTRNSLIAFGPDWTVGQEVKSATIAFHTPSQTNLLIADLPTAQRLLGRPGQIDAIWMRRASTGHISFLEDALPGLLTGLSYRSPKLEIEGFDAQDMSSWNPTHSFAGSIAFNLSLLGALAVLVASFIAYEASSSNVTRRALETSRLLSLGASQAQIRTVFLFEALFLAIVGSALGIVAAIGLLQVLNFVDVDAITNSFAIGAMKSAFIGVLAFLTAAYIASSRPQEKPRKVWHGMLIALSLGVLVFGLLPDSGLIGAFLVVVAFCLIQVFVVVPLTVGLLRQLEPRPSLKRLVRVLFLRLAVRQFKVFQIPLNAFSIAIATAIGIGLMVSSFRVNFEDLLDQRIQPGLHLANAAGVDVQQIAEWEGVMDVRPYFRSIGRLSDGSVSIRASQLDMWEASRYGYDQPISQGALINRQLATRHGLSVGSDLEIRLSDGTQLSLPVLHEFNSYGRVESVAIVHVDSVGTADWVRDRITLQVAERYRSSISKRLKESYPEVEVSDNSEIRSVALQVFDRTFVLTNAIAVVAVIVAIVGLLSSSIALHERQNHEYRLLRTIGLSERQLTFSTIFQSGVFGVLSCAISIPLGVAIAWALCVLVNPRAFQWTIDLHFHASPLVVPISLSILAAMLACVIPYLIRTRQRN